MNKNDITVNSYAIFCEASQTTDKIIKLPIYLHGNYNRHRKREVAKIIMPIHLTESTGGRARFLKVVPIYDYNPYFYPIHLSSARFA